MSENRPRNLVSFGIVYFVVVTVDVRRTTRPKTNSNIAMTNRLFWPSDPVAGSNGCDTVIGCVNPMPLAGANTAKV